jgi:hypothetical protein
MMAFVARPRSKAVGAVGFAPNLKGAVETNKPSTSVMNHVDLRTYGFNEDRTDHSGQFNRPIQEVWGLYERIFNEALRKE